jgi:hypothetical protein
MATTPNQTGSLVFGGLFIGVWAYVALFITEVDSGPWSFWGLVGLLIAGGIYGARVSHDALRIALLVGLGVAVGCIVAASLWQEIAEALAALLTFLGGALIVSALPVPAHSE